MSRNRAPSPQTMKVLGALASDPARWRYGYELSAETGLKAGTLYPILVRLAEREFLDAKWEESPPEGRPARHLYRITANGAALAAEHDPGPAPKAAARVSRVRAGHDGAARDGGRRDGAGRDRAGRGIARRPQPGGA